MLPAGCRGLEIDAQLLVHPFDDFRRVDSRVGALHRGLVVRGGALPAALGLRMAPSNPPALRVHTDKRQVLLPQFPPPRGNSTSVQSVGIGSPPALPQRPVR